MDSQKTLYRRQPSEEFAKEEVDRVLQGMPSAAAAYYGRRSPGAFLEEKGLADFGAVGVLA